MLGLPPMNQLDLSATPMRACFAETPDLTPYKCRANKIPLDKGPAPMDIGAMSYQCGHCGGEEAEVVVGVINGSCYRCGGWGHLATDCAMP